MTVPMPGYSTCGVARAAIISVIVLAVPFYAVLIYKASESIDLSGLSFTRDLTIDRNRCPYLENDKCSLRKVLLAASTPEKTVILTTLNDAWAAPDSVFDLFLESFRIGEGTRHLLKHLVIISLDLQAFSRCSALHAYCYPLITEGADLSHEAYYMSPEYLKMMWSRVDFLRSVLEMGFNFVFTDADVMWFRDPFPHFDPHADFQMACDHYFGESDDMRNIPNGGFSFVRSNSKSISFYKFWYYSRSRYPHLHDQDVLNRIRNSSYVREIGIKMRFLDTDLFGGFCEPSKDMSRVCTMHANCCLGLSSKLHDLRVLLEDWEDFLSLPADLKSYESFWRVPQNCSIESLLRKPRNEAALPPKDPS